MQVVGGQEKRVLALLKRNVSDDLLQECFIPQCETMKRHRGEWHRQVETLFPGYLVVLTDRPERLALELQGIPRFTRLLGNDDLFIPLNDREIAFFEAFTDAESRVIALSEGITEGGRAVILKGPLKGHEGMIKKIDRHKRLAYLEMDMMGRRKTIKLGLEIVNGR